MPRLRALGTAVAVMRAGDGSAPVNALAAALGPLLEPGRSETEQLAQLPALADLIVEPGLLDVIPRVLAATDMRRLVIVVDQAEQLLEQPPNAVDALLGILFSGPARAELGVVLILRADYLDAALRHTGLAGPLGGQLSGSLARYAEEVWASIPQAEQEAARRLFLALVWISRDGSRSSRRAATEEQLGSRAGP